MEMEREAKKGIGSVAVARLPDGAPRRTALERELL
jgi:hypothetical protein